MALSGKSGVSGGIEIRGTVVGEAVYTAATTAAALDDLGAGTAGKAILATSTTAAAQDTLGLSAATKNIGGNGIRSPFCR